MDLGLVTCGVVQLKGKRMAMALGDVALEVFFLDLDRMDSGWFQLYPASRISTVSCLTD